MARAVSSTSSRARIQAALAFLTQHAADAELTIVAASRGAADELARALVAERGATFGVSRYGFNELVARLAAPVLARARVAPASPLGLEAVAARVSFAQADDLRYFEPVARMPGFPRSVARTLGELALAGVEAGRLAALGDSGADLADLERGLHAETERSGLVGRAGVLRAASAAVATSRLVSPGRPLVLLDVPIDGPRETALVGALLARAGSALFTVATDDRATTDALKTLDVPVDVVRDGGAAGALGRLGTYLFSTEAPPDEEEDESVQLFSAPGEGRECLEIVRRILQRAADGVRFDEMAVLVRSPQQYIGLLEHACARAGVPAWFDRGTRRPDPAGRALLALLACANEDLSARRFAEYLSLGQVPTSGETEAGSAIWVGPEREGEEGEQGPPGAGDEWTEQDPAAPIAAGSLRTPWQWERLLVDSRLIHYRDRWHRRLDGLDAEYARKLEALIGEEPESPRISAIERERDNLHALQGFALPLIDTFAGWPESDRWAGWLSRLHALVPKVLRRPTRVLRVLAELAPLGDVGPVTLREVSDVLAQRLSLLDVEPPNRRYGRVFVGSPHQARGRSFRVVFVPGLAERLFPQRPHEDPLLLDDRRKRIDAGLALQATRGTRERLLLQLAAGAATERLYISFPSLELGESRPRVPSFYALDVVRAVTGTLPGHDTLARKAASASGARLAWPAPQDPTEAFDDLEHDLSVLARLFKQKDGAATGHAHYLLKLNAHLKRAVIERWSRSMKQWSPADGVMRTTDATRPLLEQHRLTARPYSLSALQRYAACPYQFLLSAIYRLAPVEEPVPLQRMDPLTRGSLFHSIQTAFFRTLEREGRLPIQSVASVRETLSSTVRDVADAYRDELAPAVSRVWDDEVRVLERDLLRWLDYISPDPHGWEPWRFEFAFGLPDDRERDPRSVPQPARVGGRFLLRGSVDLVERHPPTGRLRVTDHKTGKDRSTRDQVINGGTVLQPVLYAEALENVLDQPVQSGRLFFCTSAGGYSSHEIPIVDRTRALGIEALTIVDRAIELGRLMAAPAEDACTWCDFRPVCGPSEFKRTRRKHPALLEDLQELRTRP
jgi:ATP-dependent helicase/nuclease subunit B